MRRANGLLALRRLRGGEREARRQAPTPHPQPRHGAVEEALKEQTETKRREEREDPVGNQQTREGGGEREDEERQGEQRGDRHFGSCLSPRSLAPLSGGSEEHSWCV